MRWHPGRAGRVKRRAESGWFRVEKGGSPNESAFMNEIAKLILAASALLLCGELAAQTFKCTNAAGKITYSGTKTALLLCGELAAQTFKCTNAAGKITYSGTKCNELGLKDAGEVK